METVHGTSAQWQTYMDGFPENHEPPISGEYSDLTTMFRPATYVPNPNQRADTLKEFLLSEATNVGVDEAERLAPYASLPRVGDPAPGIGISGEAAARADFLPSQWVTALRESASSAERSVPGDPITGRRTPHHPS